MLIKALVNMFKTKITRTRTCSFVDINAYLHLSGSKAAEEMENGSKAAAEMVNVSNAAEELVRHGMKAVAGVLRTESAMP